MEHFPFLGGWFGEFLLPRRCNMFEIQNKADGMDDDDGR